MSEASRDEVIRRYLAAYEVLRRQYEEIYGSLISLQTALALIKRLSDVRGKEVRFPIGAGAYIKARLGEENKVLVDMGAGVSVEVSSEEATKIFEEEIKKAQEILDKLEESISSIQAKIYEILRSGKEEKKEEK